MDWLTPIHLRTHNIFYRDFHLAPPWRFHRRRASDPHHYRLARGHLSLNFHSNDGEQALRRTGGSFRRHWGNSGRRGGSFGRRKRRREREKFYLASQRAVLASGIKRPCEVSFRHSSLASTF